MATPLLHASPAPNLKGFKERLRALGSGRKDILVDHPLTPTPGDKGWKRNSATTEMSLQSDIWSSKIKKAIKETISGTAPQDRSSDDVGSTKYKLTLHGPIGEMTDTFVKGSLKVGKSSSEDVMVHCLSKGRVDSMYEDAPTKVAIHEAVYSIKAHGRAEKASVTIRALHLTHPTHWMIIQELTQATLHDWFKNEKSRHGMALAQASLSNMIYFLLTGLSKLAKSGLYQRDLTPYNLYVVGAGAASRIKIRSFAMTAYFPGGSVTPVSVKSAPYSLHFNHPIFFKPNTQPKGHYLITRPHADKQMAYQLASIIHHLFFGTSAKFTGYAKRSVSPIDEKEVKISAHLYNLLRSIFPSHTSSRPTSDGSTLSNAKTPTLSNSEAAPPLDSLPTLDNLMKNYINPWYKEMNDKKT
ncbi:hypothetical protein BJ684DRAFT_21857 [Piptocephalis cylindrospora]|uniref:Protein kinase domain-containing protein n=1 Tax=Piptocephalis cylindrospora TaxID=1907219 RepID=A0A4P9XYP5_9FUNG|nr:hypothetical protein BJ684DRAFT_21857 [Piptocephalis cylindrospora]|eukprot:RKP11563.1 hypothetical protein BJ684DRAFT_21857 [Piptocephalis cylindrospora]